MTSNILNVLILILCTVVIGVLVAYIIKFMLYIMDRIQYIQSFKFGYFKTLFRAARIKNRRIKKLYNEIEYDDLLFDYYYSKEKEKEKQGD